MAKKKVVPVPRKMKIRTKGNSRVGKGNLRKEEGRGDPIMGMDLGIGPN